MIFEIRTNRYSLYRYKAIHTTLNHGRSFEPARWCSELAWRALELGGRAVLPAARALRPAGWVSEPAGRALEPAGRVSEPAGRASETAVWTPKPAGRPWSLL